MTGIPIALQLYTVRDETARDFAGTLRRVAALGYPAVELAGYGGLAPGSLRALLDETGLAAPASHVSFDALLADLDREIAFCREVGCAFLVLPSLPPEARDPESVRALAPRLDDFGRGCRAAGLQFAYHNHQFEFEPAGGAYLLDHLLDATDPDLVSVELDVYWAAFAGADPVAFLRRRATRVALLHLKDMTPDRDFTEIGAGILDMPAIVAAGVQSGVHWYIVENDRPRLPSLESARRSLEYLRAMSRAAPDGP
jgi:sugar phosphate isomerase/epimerase